MWIGQLTSTESEHGMSSNQEQQTRPVVIVTGASGGIGEATARALHAAGYRVFGTYRRPPATRSPGIEYLACDVTRDESVKAAVGQVLAKAGRIDLLVNNAGVGLIAGAEESSLEQAKSLFDVNLFGVFRMTMKSGLRASEWCWSSRPTRGLPSRATSTRQTSSSTSTRRPERTRREFC